MGCFPVHGIAWERGWRKSIFKLDSEVGFNLIMHGCGENLPSFALVAFITSMLNRNWRVSLKHCYRQANRIADRLACYAHSFEAKLLQCCFLRTRRIVAERSSSWT